jgi:hypothetical protein
MLKRNAKGRIRSLCPSTQVVSAARKTLQGAVFWKTPEALGTGWKPIRTALTLVQDEVSGSVYYRLLCQDEDRAALCSSSPARLQRTAIPSGIACAKSALGDSATIRPCDFPIETFSPLAWCTNGSLIPGGQLCPSRKRSLANGGDRPHERSGVPCKSTCPIAASSTSSRPSRVVRSQNSINL